MNLFRTRTLHKQIEDSVRWSYPAKLAKRPTRRNGLGNDGTAADNSSHLESRASKLGDNAGKNYARRGTINLIKNLMRHRVNYVQTDVMLDSGSGSDSNESEGAKLRRALQKKVKKDSTFGNRPGRKVKGGIDDGDDLERGDGSEDDDDELNLRTGGAVMLEKNDGTVAQGTGKVIPNKRNFGRKN